MVLGAVAAVLRYNVLLGRSPNFLRSFLYPARSFFGDFGALVPGGLALRAIEAFAKFCPEFGSGLKKQKPECGSTVASLGIEGFPHFGANNYPLQVPHTTE